MAKLDTEKDAVEKSVYALAAEKKLKDIFNGESFWSPLEAKELSSTLTKAGHKVYVVGGFVRDVIRNTDIPTFASDIDFATSALPQEVESVFKKTFPSGKAHGTITVLMGEQSFEVTTFRSDGVYKNNRHPSEVSFSRSLAEDVTRRDFTVNALAYQIESEQLIDLCDGLGDLKNRRLRSIGKASDRFTEDALRMLRACRFTAQLNFTASAEIENAIKEKAHLIKNIAAERVREEWNKIFLCKKPSTAIKMMQYTNLLNIIIPELSTAHAVEQNKHHAHCVQTHTAHVVDAVFPLLEKKFNEYLGLNKVLFKAKNKLKNLPKWYKDDLQIIRWAALFHDLGKVETKAYSEEKKDYTFYGHENVSHRIALKIMKRYKFANSQQKIIANLVKNHMLHYESSWTDAAVRRFIARVGEDDWPLLISLVMADRMGKEEMRTNDEYSSETLAELFPDLAKLEGRVVVQLKNKAALSVASLAINGKLIMQHCGLPPGPMVGKVLAHLLELVIEEPRLNKEKKLLAEAAKFLKQKK